MRKRHGLIAVCVCVTVLPAAVAWFGLATGETSAAPICGPTPTPTPTPIPSTTPNPTPSPVPLCKPILTKAFSPDTIEEGATSTLTFTVTNPNQSFSLFGISFSDTLPTGVEVVTPVFAGCGAIVTAPTGGSQIDVSIGSVGANSSCTVSVDVTPTTTGEFLNTTSGITASGIGGPGDPATATLTATPAYISQLVADVDLSGTTVVFSLRHRANVSVRIDKRVRGGRTYRRLRTLRIAHAKRGRHRLRLKKLQAGHYRVYVRALAHGDRGLGIRRSFTVHRTN